jgi:hypothetical protein
MKDPSYYRDILNKILQEDEDIPLPPSRFEIKRDQFIHSLSGVSIPKYTFVGD